MRNHATNFESNGDAIFIKKPMLKSYLEKLDSSQSTLVKNFSFPTEPMINDHETQILHNNSGAKLIGLIFLTSIIGLFFSVTLLLCGFSWFLAFAGYIFPAPLSVVFWALNL